MNIRVMNMNDAERYSKEPHSENTVFISITSYSGVNADIKVNTTNNIKDILFLKLNDTDLVELGGMKASQADLISNFVLKYKDNKNIDELIVHCEAGRSRSAGVAAAILKYLYKDDTPIFNNPKYNPNMLCYRAVLNSLLSL